MRTKESLVMYLIHSLNTEKKRKVLMLTFLMFAALC